MERHHVISAATLLALVGLLAQPAAGQVRYAVTDLGAIWRGAAVAPELIERFYSSGINDSGQIIGGYETVFGDCGAFLWDPTSGLRELGNLGRSDRTSAYAINNRGQVVGYGTTDLLSGGGPHAFLWSRDDGMLDLGSLGGNVSDASDINDNGAVVGAAWPGNEWSHAFLWTADVGMRDLGTLGGDFSGAIAVNNVGQVVGASSPSPDIEVPFRAFMWTESLGMRDLGSLSQINPRDINDLGQIAGTLNVPLAVPDETTTEGCHLALWQDGVTRDLGSLGGERSSVTAMNNRGQIVGSDMTAEGYLHGLLWEEHLGVQDLNTLVGRESPWTIRATVDINNLGWILASGVKDDGQHAPLLLTPVPEPATAAMLAALGAAVGGIRMRAALRGGRVRFGVQSGALAA